MIWPFSRQKQLVVVDTPETWCLNMLEDDDTAGLTERWRRDMAGRCPDCGVAAGFYEGPRGGACQNVQCVNDECAARFNLCLLPDGATIDQRIRDSKLSRS